MKRIKGLIIIVLSLFIFFPLSLKAEEHDVNFYLFYGRECPHCEELMEWLDVYMAENDKTYKAIFEEIAEAINEEGFFNSKMSKKELKDKMSNPLSSMNMNEVIKNSAEKAIAKVAEQEFQGYRA